MISQHGDASKIVHHLKDLKKSMKEDEITIVGFFQNVSSPLVSAYLDAGNTYDLDRCCFVFIGGLQIF